MHIFISEYVCSGAWPDEDFEPSLLREAKAMIRSVIEDFQGIPNLNISLTWDSRLDHSEFEDIHNLSITVINSVESEWRAFQDLSSKSDRTLVIAPEFDQILEKRILHLQQQGHSSLCGTHDAVRLCSDKLRLATFLTEHGIQTPKTSLLSDIEGKLKFPVVVKPRYGAGSQAIRVVSSEVQFRELSNDIRADEYIIQNLVSGVPLSVGVLKSLHSERFEILPIASQSVSAQDYFQYHGGAIPYQLEEDTYHLIKKMVSSVVRCIPGLKGYIGIDFVLSEDGQITIIEINPRLTTSFYGYQKLTKTNLLERVLYTNAESLPPLEWMNEPFSFQFDDAGSIF